MVLNNVTKFHNKILRERTPLGQTYVRMHIGKVRTDGQTGVTLKASDIIIVGT